MSRLHLFAAVAASAVLAVVANSYAAANSGVNGNTATATATATSGAGYCGGRANEQWVKCTDSCLPKRCSELGFHLPCPPHGGGCSQGPGCVCYPGYVRNDKGFCVPLKHCPSCGNDPNAESGCGTCRRTCANCNSTQPQVCTEMCILNACNCKPGFLYDENTKKCVRLNECTPICGPDEVFNPCTNAYCGPTTCKELASNNKTICVQPPKCRPGCLCKKGYYRNDAGKCVPENQCPCRQCGKNEHYTTCPDDCRPKKCSELGFPIACPGVAVDGSCPSKPGCVCDDGYVKDDKGVCIPIKKCPSCGGDPNAENGCGNCRITCGNYNSTEPMICPQYCDLNGCDCKSGFVLNTKTKKCVKPSECPPKCGPDEVFHGCTNGICGPKTCKELASNESSACVEPPKCRPGCLCKKGYYRNDAGKCVPENQCPCRQCGKNEHYTTCPDDCRPKKCSELGFPIACPGVAVDGSCPSKPGCVCDDGYVKDDKGVCIPIKKCPSCGGDPNAENGCGNCRKTCENHNSTEPMICLKYCDMNGCDCKPGFVLNTKTKKCVKPSECPPCKGPNEHYEQCPTCTVQKCTEVGFPIACPLPGSDSSTCPKKPACVCDNGYVRDAKGICVPKNQCPSCRGDPNAVSGCGVCRPTCQNNGVRPKICPRICPPNGCDCRPGYWYDEVTKKCVLPKDCINCGGRQNEHYESCPDDCVPRKCIQLGYPLICSASSTAVGCPTKPACVCDDGHVRSENGTCIPIQQCPSCGGDENAEHGCGNCPVTCDNKDNKEPRFCAQYCDINGCNCKQGFVLNEKLKKCVRPSECTKKCGPDEYFDPCANGGCYDARLCSDLDTFNGAYICVDPIECKPGCLCNEGLLRDSRGLCIPENWCPNSRCKGDNERYVPCDTKCIATTCDQLGFPLNECKLPSPGSPCQGDPACICKEGYVRDKDGNCIPTDQCPSCGGDPNAVSGCGSNCGRRCSDYNKPVGCSAVCNTNGCDCKEGFLYDDNLKKCVPPEKCSPVCGQNEVYSRCANSGCGIRNCSQIMYKKQPSSPVCVPPKVCVEGCVCADGYLRNNNGVCVPKMECPLNSLCLGKGKEFLDICPGCVFETCPNLEQPVDCAPPGGVCKPRCRCAKGYYRNSHGVCVTEKQCYQCGKNEVYDKCVSSCPPRKCGRSDAIPCAPPNPDQCMAGCRCADGFVRNDKGECVSPDECPKSCKGDPNARPGCGVNCGRHCSNYNKGPVACIAICYIDGCDCNEGYVYDDNLKKCVPPHECTPICGYNEEYTPCVEGGCYDARNCSEISNGQKPPIKCVKPIKCTAGCQCLKGYLRNDNGICVPREECQVNGRCSGKAYQFYDYCPPNCLTETCSGIGKPVDCLPQAAVCRPRCRCAPGHYRDNQGICVPEDMCPKNPCTKANEIYDECPAKCPPRVCGIDDRLIDCAPPPLPGDPNCPPPACRCADGFYRDDKGECVKWEKCPKCPPHEVYDPCDAPCPGRHCSVDERLIKCAAPPKPGDSSCVVGCRCEDGYKRNDKGICIPKELCPKKCPPHEVYDPCDAPCPGRHCSVDERLVKCAAPPKPGDPSCVVGCRCEDGYKRNDKGMCIPKELCPLICRGANEEYDPCPTCDPNTCESIGKVPNNCPLIPNVCKGACRCKLGYYRNKLGECISKENCLKCSKPHEFYSCGSACDNVCSNLSQQNRTRCPIINIKCNEMCYCEDGYARDRLGNCVPIQSCRRCKGPREWYDTCSPSCPPNSCEAYGKAYSCPAQTTDTSKCKASCRCEDGYLRDKNGTCIAQEKCPCNEDPNAEPGCCSRTCSDYQANKQPICNKLCHRNACRCKYGYVLNEKTGKCVLPGDCPKQCGKNEVFDKCVTPCPPRVCGINDAAVLCAPTNPDDCKAGCRCADGYVKNDKGECVLPKDCQGCNKDPNARPGCGCSRTCSDYRANRPPKCTKDCKIGACDCRDGYVLEENSKLCVLPQDCPGVCGANPVSTPRPDDGSSPSDNDDAVQALLRGISVFACKFLQEVLRVKPSENVIMSPYSVQVALGQLGMKSEGNTEKQLLASLNFENKDQIAQAFKTLSNTAQGRENVTFSKAVKVYVNDVYPLSDSFLNDTKNVFNGSAENIDCNDPTGTANSINHWVASQTNDHIKDLIPANMINSLTRLILVNAVYFDAKWKEQFKKELTEPADFYTIDKRIVQVPMMHIETKLKYANNDALNAQVLLLPYANTNFSFLLILPREKDGFAQTVANLNADTLKAARDDLYLTKVKLSMPSMELNTSLDLVDILKVLGITDMFDPSKANFQGIVKQFEPLFVTAAVQKSYCKVNEEGTEAASATGVVVGTRSLPPVQVTNVVADHPHLFFISNNENILFCGARLN